MKKLLVVLVFLSVVTAWFVPTAASALTEADITITATPTYIAMTVSDGGTNTWALSTVVASTQYWYTADSLVPAEPLVDTDMKIVLTNTGSVAENFSIHGHDFTGGAGWVLSEDNTPAEDQVSIRAGVTGMANLAAMVQVIHEDTELKHEVASSGHIDSCLGLLTATFTDGVAKSSTVTISCAQHV